MYGIDGRGMYMLLRRVHLAFPLLLLLVLLLIVLAGLVSPTSTQAALQLQPLNLDAQLNRQPLWRYSLMQADPRRRWDFDAIGRADFESGFTPMDATMLNQGITGMPFWIKLELHNPSDKPIDWVLAPETSYVDYLDIVALDDTGRRQRVDLSDHKPFAERALPYRKLNFSYRTAPGATTQLYIRMGMIDPATLTLGLYLWQAEQFDEQMVDEQFGFGAYFGVLLCLLLLCTMLWVMLRERVYVSYLVYLLANGLLWACLSGHAYQYLWPNSPEFNRIIYSIVILLAAITAVQFSRDFLGIKKRMPRLDRWLKGFMLVCLAAIGLRLFGVYEPVVRIAFVAIASLALLPLIGWYCYRDGLVYARGYTLAWIIYASGILISILSASGLFNWGMEPLLYTQIASLVEVLILAMALVDKVRQLQLGFERASAESEQDPLTGLGNRRLLDRAGEALQQQLAQSQKIFLFILDVDHFKRINDCYGHRAGDRVLEKLAEVMARYSRPEDTLVRYGGEEFVQLLRLESLSTAMTVAERIRNHFADEPTDTEQGRIRHTVSIGVVEVEAGMTNGVESEPGVQIEVPFDSDTQTEATTVQQHASESPPAAEGALEQALERADRALYAAKAGGRNRVELYSDELLERLQG